MSLNYSVTHSVTVGQEVAIGTGGSYKRYLFGYFVTKISPTGQITVVRPASEGVQASTFRFTPNGRQIGGSQYGGYRLMPDVEALKQFTRRDKLAREASVLIEAVRVHRCLPTYNLEAMRQQIKELQDQLDRARAAVEALEAP